MRRARLVPPREKQVLDGRGKYLSTFPFSAGRGGGKRKRQHKRLIVVGSRTNSFNSQRKQGRFFSLTSVSQIVAGRQIGVGGVVVVELGGGAAHNKRSSVIFKSTEFRRRTAFSGSESVLDRKYAYRVDPTPPAFHLHCVLIFSLPFNTILRVGPRRLLGVSGVDRFHRRLNDNCGWERRARADFMAGAIRGPSRPPLLPFPYPLLMLNTQHALAR